MKVDANKRPRRGYFGFTPLTSSQLTSIYQNADELVSAFTGVATNRFLPLPTYFERPIGPLFAALIDRFEVNPSADLTLLVDYSPSSLPSRLLFFVTFHPIAI